MLESDNHEFSAQLYLIQNLLKPVELSRSLKNLIGYTLELKPSQIPHKDAGQGLFIDGQADVGTVIAFYPGIIYSPAYYCYIPGYPRVDTHNPYLITRYDGTVINAQLWGVGGEIREVWDLSSVIKSRPNVKDDANNKGSDQIWKMLNKPLQATRVVSSGDVLERRNPLAFAHFANHPAKEMVPNVMVCPYDFPLTEKDMRTYIPNIKFGSGEEAKMKRFGSFWFIGSNPLPLQSFLFGCHCKVFSKLQFDLFDYNLTMKWTMLKSSCLHSSLSLSLSLSHTHTHTAW
ncbi:uncharacterized protein LOC114276758 [Camellia sinensis]|uniref:uncharacterized protein LOC114276758 n=1 Tax=Camellia sinensis TaxID=4442 RepID=UPI00103677A9|nr:uncharacterized protein LOC114276758 [Camellia sinensis]